jgi:hypothetical protein
MQSKRSKKVATAIAKAQRRFDSPDSALHRRAAKALRELEQAHAAAVEAIERRCAQREQEAETAARDALRDMAPVLGAEAARNVARMHRSWAGAMNATDEQLLELLDRSALGAVDALRSDRAFQATLAGITGGLILAGALGGTPAALAALGSAALLVAQVRTQVLSVKGPDANAVRIERATILIEHVGKMSRAWASILK